MESQQEKKPAVKASRLAVFSMALGILSPIVPHLIGIMDPYFAITGLLGLCLGVAALVQIRKSKGLLRGRFYAFLGILTSAAWVVLITWRMIIPAVTEARWLATRPPTFDGPSTDLKQTVVVPTLDTPIHPGNNVIWCSSFQLAWNKLKDDIIKESVRLTDSNELAQLLNNAPQSASDIDPADSYAAAGLAKDAVVERIKTDMKAKFPEVTVPDFKSESPNDIIVYSFLRAGIRFTVPFRSYPHEFLFYDSQNHETPVACFGFWGEGTADYRAAEQVQLLYYSETRDPNTHKILNSEFALDLCKNTTPYQIVAAVIEPAENLHSTLADLEGKISRYAAAGRSGPLHNTDVLLVPDMFWEVSHRFGQLEGKSIVNEGFEAYFLSRAFQDIRFRLDRSGVALQSAAAILATLAGPRELAFNRPFLIYLKKRGADNPFFVMWVENPELLTKRQ